MNTAQLKGCEEMHRNTMSVLKHSPKSAREMAETPHRLSRDGSVAVLPNGEQWVWDHRFEHWARWI